jgi:hypothetical protein
MFSNYYHLGNTIELFNLQNKNLCSKWHFEGKYSKLFDPSLKCYEMILSTGNLSKMLIPKVKKNSKIKTLSLFQGYVVFQLYLFTSKQFSIELAISDTTNAKRRLIFSSNNDNLVINQLHCRIPIFELPIGKWINLSIDILSFVSECFKNLTFRSVDFISLSMSGKVRYIFTMRTPLIDNITQFEGGEEKNDYDFDDCGNKISDNSGNSSFIYGAKDIPDKYKFPGNETPININMNCNYVLQQITLQNQIKQLSYQQKLILNSDPILIQDTADASNMDKGLKFRHNIFLQNKKKMKKFRRYPFEENFFENPFNNYNNNIEFDNGYGYDYILDNNLMENNMNMNNDYYRHRQLSDGALMNENGSSNYNNNNVMNNNNNVMNIRGQNQNQSTERFKNIGNLIVSQDKNNNLFNPYKNNINDNYKNNADENNIIIQQEDGQFKNNRYGSYNSLKYSRENNNNEGDKHKFIFFNKDEYNKLYNSGKGSAEQITHNLHLNEKNNINNINNDNNNNNNNEIDEKYNYQLSTIKNENANSNNSELVEEEKKNYIGQILEDSLNLINNSQNNEFLANNNNKGNNNEGNNNNDDNNKGEQRPFSPPITKIDDAEEQENLF